ncbi:hypothetical protein G5714_004280 [Onychostoma macrolepis]|uniref:Uncharacterized protein n=1 Tax=Onychostoma macrolepis TaxID=369639 RepID=A0A7J6D4C6_9TELE|nr:hypothetical protein G5714_004280 [Onychostoma macrolepis]
MAKRPQTLAGDLPIIAQKTAATAETSAKTQIEVIKGCGVFCQAEAWRAARLATSATAMVQNLLLGTFDLETLLKSNLNGGKPTRGDGEQLDQIKKAAIIEVKEISEMLFNTTLQRKKKTDVKTLRKMNKQKKMIN